MLTKNQKQEMQKHIALCAKEFIESDMVSALIEDFGIAGALPNLTDEQAETEGEEITKHFAEMVDSLESHLTTALKTWNPQ